MSAAARLDRRRFLWVAFAVPAGIAAIVPSLPLWLTGSLLAAWVIALALGWRGKVLPLLLRLSLTLPISLVVLANYGFQLGRDTGAALLSMLLILKLLELRTVRDARSAIAFGLFAAMAAFLLDQAPEMLLLSGAASILLLAALAEVAELEAHEGPAASSHPPSIATQPPAKARRRIGWALRMLALSLPLAAVGFFLFPRLGSPLWGYPGRAGESHTGLSDEMSPGDIAQLFADDSPAMRVRFHDITPLPDQMYWRGPVLSDFDGRRWRRSRFFERAAVEQFEPLGPSIHYQVIQEPSDRRYVLALDVPDSTPERAQVVGPRMLLADHRLADVRRFELSSTLSYRLDARSRFPGTMQRLMTELPPGFNPRTRELVQRWQSEGADAHELIRRTMAMFQRDFRYTLQPSVLGHDSIDDFLFRTRAGYCEHFASAFTVMMRMAGIPARVVTGYQGAYYNPIGEHWVVRQSDAHAWSEVWLPGEGWVRVDPTSVVAPQRIENGSESLREESAWGRLARPLLDTADWLRRGWNDIVLGFDAVRQQRMLSPFGIDARNWRQIGMLLAGAAALGMLLTLWLLRRHAPPPREPLLNAWDQFVQRLRRAGVPCRSIDPPRRLALRAVRRLPRAASEINALSERFIAWRYAGHELDAEARARLRRDLRRFRIPPSKPKPRRKHP